MSHEAIRANFSSLKSTPVAIQALWDGDTDGWFIWLSAITKDGVLHQLGAVSLGGDIRIFNGQVPPWPEAAVAQQLGSELARSTGAEFYFPSPDHPEDQCPDWRDRDKGYPCRRCGILLLQRPDSPRHGICYFCLLKEEHEQREAQWTAEQRAGPRCRICGAPAEYQLGAQPACADCFDKYEIFTCEKCGSVSRVLKSERHGPLCWGCEIQQFIDMLTEAQRDMIRDARAENEWKAIMAAKQITGCSIHDAEYVVHVIGSSKPSGNST